MRVDVYSDFTLKDILQSYSSIQFSECIRDVGDIQLSFTDSEVYRNISVTEDVLVTLTWRRTSIKPTARI